MHRLALVVLLVAACKGKESPPREVPVGAGSGSATTPAGSGSGSAVSAAKPIDPPAGTAPKLAWKDPEGELLVATEDGKTLIGPCGLTGTLTATEVAMGTQKPEPWNKVLRDGRTYSMGTLDWKIEVSPSGEVVLKQHGDKKPLGTVTGLDTDEAAAWFGAFVVAAPMVQHTLQWTSPDGKATLAIGGAADFRAWTITEGTTKIASRERQDPAPLLAPGPDKPAWDPLKINVAIDGVKKYVVSVKRDDPATAKAFTSDLYTITEADDGALSMLPATGTAKAGSPIPLGKLTGRAACRAHDQALPALLWTLFASKSGHAKVFGT